MANWYVRPNTGHNTTRNGTSYATAWGGWSEIVWGVSGVNAGDTLYVCGRHEYSSGISVGAHTGGAGTKTTISGELSNDPGSLIFSGGAFLTNARSYTNIVGITFQGGTSVCVYQFSGTITGNSYLRNTFIDGNGILFDFGTQNSKAYRNTLLNIQGRPEAVNSGVGIMILDSTGVLAYGNYIDSCKIGIFIGDKAGGQSCTIQNNTFLNCSHYGVYMLSTADQTTCIVRNNIFTGQGNSVTNLGSAWSLENYNCFYTLSAPTGHTFGANTITTSPNLRYGAPTSGTPDGTTVGYLSDWEKQQYFIPPTIGALQYVSERAVR